MGNITITAWPQVLTQEKCLFDQLFDAQMNEGIIS